ncbi:MAG: hypothetical protein AAGC55_33870, partial [Myxococcota bacterium]
ERLIGSWSSPMCETRPDGQGGFLYLKRHFQFAADSTWSGIFAFYTDDTCTTPVSSVDISGGYALGGPSARVYDAIEAEFELATVVVTAHIDFFADYLNSAEPGACGSKTWVVGEAQDISETGCLLIGVDHDSCPVEHEVVHLAGQQLYFGARPQDGGNLCTPERRPMALQTAMIRAE